MINFMHAHHVFIPPSIDSSTLDYVLTTKTTAATAPPITKRQYIPSIT